MTSDVSHPRRMTMPPRIADRRLAGTTQYRTEEEDIHQWLAEQRLAAWRSRCDPRYRGATITDLPEAIQRAIVQWKSGVTAFTCTSTVRPGVANLTRDVDLLPIDEFCSAELRDWNTQS